MESVALLIKFHNKKHNRVFLYAGYSAKRSYWEEIARIEKDKRKEYSLSPLDWYMTVEEFFFKTIDEAIKVEQDMILQLQSVPFSYYYRCLNKYITGQRS